MRKAILTMVCVAHILLAFSQNYFNKKIISFPLKDGLASPFVLNIVQDNRGFIWFNSAGALTRFDGLNFKVFKFDTNSPNSLPGKHIYSFFKDNQGEIWASFENGIYTFNVNNERFAKYTSKVSAKFTTNVSCITNCKNTLWFACREKGFFSFNKRNQRLKPYSAKNLPELSNKSITNIYQDSKGLLWAGGQNGLVAVYDTQQEIIKNLNQHVPANGVPKAKVNSIYEDYLHNIWIATSAGLTCYQRSQNRYYVFNGPKFNMQSNNFFSLVEDNNHNLLIGLQDGGLYRLNLKQLMKTKKSDVIIEPVRAEDNYNITKRTVQCLCIDKDKNVWAGTFGEGLYLLGNTADNFQKFQRKITDNFGTSDVRYSSMCMDNAGYLWLGTDGDGIFKSTIKGEVLKHYTADGKNGSITNNAILSSFHDSLDNLWFGSYAGGLYKYDKRTDAFINYSHSDYDKSSLCSNDVRAIFQDSRSNLWVGTNTGGLSVLPVGKTTFINYTTANSDINNTNIMAIAEDKKNNLLVGTLGSGLMYLVRRQNKFVRYFNEAEVNRLLPGKAILCIKVYLHQILLGTVGDGLVVYNEYTHSFKKYSDKNGLASNTINSIQPDNDGNIWVSTRKGISKIEKSTNKIFNYNAILLLSAGLNDARACTMQSGSLRPRAGNS